MDHARQTKKTKAMKFNLLKGVEITDFEKGIGVDLVISERDANRLPHIKKYFARFEGAELIEGHFLASISGDGDTIDEALRNYCELISNKKLCINAYTPNRIEIYVPKLEHTKRIIIPNE